MSKWIQFGLVITMGMFLAACGESTSDTSAGEATPGACYTDASYHAANANGLCSGVAAPNTNTTTVTDQNCGNPNYAYANPVTCGVQNTTTVNTGTDYGTCFNASSCNSNVVVPVQSSCTCPTGSAAVIDGNTQQIVGCNINTQAGSGVDWEFGIVVGESKSRTRNNQTRRSSFSEAYLVVGGTNTNQTNSNIIAPLNCNNTNSVVTPQPVRCVPGSNGDSLCTSVAGGRSACIAQLDGTGGGLCSAVF